MSKLTEKNGVEIPICEWLGKLGWTPRTADDLKRYERPFAQPVVQALLEERVAVINGVTPSEARQAVNILLNTQHLPVVATANEQFLHLLREGVTLRLGNKDRTLKLIDLDKVWQNDFTVTRQYWVHGSELVKPDLVCLVNGIPLIPFEAKQRAQQASDWIKGVHDLAVYQSKVPRLLGCNLFAIACNGRMARYGVPGQPASLFAEWQDHSVDPTPGNPLAAPAAGRIRTGRTRTLDASARVARGQGI